MFRVNGVDIFAKGSNWIPAHILPEKVTEEYIYDLLYSAKEAHMNMIRVWGGIKHLVLFETHYYYISEPFVHMTILS